MIIDWALEHDADSPNAEPISDSRSAARLTTAGQEKALPAHSSPHAEASLRAGQGFGSVLGSPRERLQHTPGERLRTSNSHKRTPWAAMSYDGVENHTITAMDLAALQLRGGVQYTPVERRQLHSGRIAGLEAGSPTTQAAMADARQTQRELLTARQAAERPGPAQAARQTVTQVFRGVEIDLACKIQFMCRI